MLTNRKEPHRQGKAQLIDASSFWTPMRKSLGNKRREISRDQIQEISKIYQDFQDGEYSKIFRTEDFGYRKITVERPLRLNFQASPERLARLQEHKAFQNLSASKKKDLRQKALEETEGREQQEAILSMLATLPNTLFKDRPTFEATIDKAARTSKVKLASPIRKAILMALSERDETAEICLDADGLPEPDPELRDTENVPLEEDIHAFFDREVRPHVPDAWINIANRDHKDGEVGKVGYEINFNRYFYKYQPPRQLELIEADIKAIEAEILGMIKESMA